MKYAHLLPAGLLLTLLLACGNSAVDSVQSHVQPSPPQTSAPAQEISQGRTLQFALPVSGPPAATLAVWMYEPAQGTPIRGTILLLHGFMGNHRQVQNAGLALRNAGYRAVIPDLRGFGQSTGGDEVAGGPSTTAHPATVPAAASPIAGMLFGSSRITFGVLDAKDMVQLTDYLQSHHFCGPTLGVYGTSYGAACAIMYASLDPRVSTVISVASFATIRDEVPSFSRYALSGVSGMLSDSQLNSIANAAASVMHFDLDDARPIDAIAKIKAPILLIHGDADTIIPHAASEQLHSANHDSQLLTIPEAGHLDLCFDFPGTLQPVTRKWFDDHLGSLVPR